MDRKPTEPTESPKPAGGAKQALIEAAVAEFSLRGLDGARIETIARRAGCNKALAYRYFDDKPGLYRAALDHVFRQRAALLPDVPPSLAEGLRFWFLQSGADADFLRLMQREALNDDGGELAGESFRRDYYDRQVEMIEALRRRGEIGDDLDTRYLFLALLTLIAFPAMMPNIVRLVSGAEVDSEEFRDNWSALLERLAKRLA